MSCYQYLLPDHKNSLNSFRESLIGLGLKEHIVCERYGVMYNWLLQAFDFICSATPCIKLVYRLLIRAGEILRFWYVAGEIQGVDEMHEIRQMDILLSNLISTFEQDVTVIYRLNVLIKDEYGEISKRRITRSMVVDRDKEHSRD